MKKKFYYFNKYNNKILLAISGKAETNLFEKYISYHRNKYGNVEPYDPPKKPIQ